MKQLVPQNQCPDMQDGLQARIHDPLWLLARQWQVGEFESDDAGGPVGAQLRLENSVITRYRPGPAEGTAQATDFPLDKVPLQTLVEQETVIPTQENNLRLAAQAGLHFSRLLNLHGLAKYVEPFLSSFA